MHRVFFKLEYFKNALAKWKGSRKAISVNFRLKVSRFRKCIMSIKSHRGMSARQNTSVLIWRLARVVVIMSLMSLQDTVVCTTAVVSKEFYLKFATVNFYDTNK